MTPISRLLAAGRTRSLEFFPPKTPEGGENLRAALAELVGLSPSFASVTYGALGSTRDTTRDLVIGMNRDLPFPTMAHLTCVGHSRAEIVALLDQYARRRRHEHPRPRRRPAGRRARSRATSPTPPSCSTWSASTPPASASGWPPTPRLHPRSRDRAEDRRHLAAKLTRADFAVTQFFFRVEDYERLRDELAALGCDRPVIPGVMPFTSADGLRRMAGDQPHDASRPDLADRLDRVERRPRGASAPSGSRWPSTSCRRLEEAGAPGLHLYTLNRAASVRDVWSDWTADPRFRRDAPVGT